MNFQQETSEALTPQQRRAHTHTIWAHMGYACVGEVGRQGVGSCISVGRRGGGGVGGMIGQERGRMDIGWIGGWARETAP